MYGYVNCDVSRYVRRLALCMKGALYIALPRKSPHNLSTSFGMAIVVPSIYVSEKVEFFLHSSGTFS